MRVKESLGFGGKTPGNVFQRKSLAQAQHLVHFYYSFYITLILPNCILLFLRWAEFENYLYVCFLLYFLVTLSPDILILNYVATSLE